ncbi:hypothetical protein KCV87_15390 [Actinosynnema pretiosum subsp. pretiosum]|uniref:Leucine-rich repeat domain-containing protein n=1 Tax=Actinosynnema pretiosum subsp. pretiosum TaxID=103721 RepID=A0AA45LDK7_9PSEU|nr:putative large ATP-binding protein [Actinosynnema pretiosum subsp. pretiosum]QUF07288.1 hypothetical protein KCV87_15390 [Actinosynnema pretiosum subsp. pretiosum]
MSRPSPEELLELSEEAAAAVVEEVARGGGVGDLPWLAGCARDGRQRVQEALVDGWRWHEPRGYAEAVLAGAPLVDGAITVVDPAQIPHLEALRHLSGVSVVIGAGAQPLAVLADVPHLTWVTLKVDGEVSLAPLAAHPRLEAVELEGADGYADLDRLGELPGLAYLHLGLAPGRTWKSLDFLAHCPNVESLRLSGLDDATDRSALGGLEHLVDLGFFEHPIGGFEGWPTSESAASLYFALSGELDLDGIADFAPNTGRVGLYNTRVADLEPLLDLEWLAELAIYDETDPLDLTPLTGASLRLTLFRSAGHVGVDGLGPGVELRYLDD